MAHALSLQIPRPAMFAMAGAALLGGCGEPSLLTVKQYLAQCDALRGKQVRVAGYLPFCSGYDCMLFSDKVGNRISFEAMNRAIGIGGDEAFDRKAAPVVPGYVVISGRVDKHNCTGAGGTDRVVGIEPTDIRIWRPDEGAPTNTQ